jgi:glycosyl hydrolase family 43
MTDKGTVVTSVGNPIIPGLGVCDPQVRVFDDVVYLYATHDADAGSTSFVMNDWWVWRSVDLVTWKLVGILRPEETYWGKESAECWATDACRRDESYFWYFSRGPREIGVVQSDRPEGPWRDPIGGPLIPEGLVPTEARDPGIFQEADGTSYIVFGTFDFYIARLADDMVSLAEPPRLIEIEQKEGPYGVGLTDDKPFLHRRDDVYYLSWGCYYATSDSLYGAYTCRGSFITLDATDQEFRDAAAAPGPGELTLDRHGSFFELHGQEYFICNDRFRPGGSMHFRDSVIAYVRYRSNGLIDPIRLSRIGVAQYDAARRIDAADYFRVHGGRVEESERGDFTVSGLVHGSYVTYPNVRNVTVNPTLTVSSSQVRDASVLLEVRRGSPGGDLLGALSLPASKAEPVSTSTHLDATDAQEHLCLVVRGAQQPMRLHWLEIR